MSHYQDSREHIINKYRIPADIKRGTPVLAWNSRNGIITGFDGGYVTVRLQGDKHSSKIHPLELAYNGEPWATAEQRLIDMNARIAAFNRALNHAK